MTCENSHKDLRTALCIPDDYCNIRSHRNQLFPRRDGSPQRYHHFLGTLVLTSGVVHDFVLPSFTCPAVLSPLSLPSSHVHSGQPRSPGALTGHLQRLTTSYLSTVFLLTNRPWPLTARRFKSNGTFLGTQGPL